MVRVYHTKRHTSTKNEKKFDKKICLDFKTFKEFIYRKSVKVRIKVNIIREKRVVDYAK